METRAGARNAHMKTMQARRSRAEQHRCGRRGRVSGVAVCASTSKTDFRVDGRTDNVGQRMAFRNGFSSLLAASCLPCHLPLIANLTWALKRKTQNWSRTKSRSNRRGTLFFRLKVVFCETSFSGAHVNYDLDDLCRGAEGAAAAAGLPVLPTRPYRIRSNTPRRSGSMV